MGAIVYYLSLPFIYGISLLPRWVLYRVSDCLFFGVYHIIGYRKAVVMENLKNSFPKKHVKELQVIRRRFYQYFCDLIVETLKTLTLSSQAVCRYVDMDNPEVFQKYHERGQSIIIVMGHWGNWEMGGARFAVEPFHKLYVIYHPLHNKYFNQLVFHMRTRLGNGLYSMKDSLRGMIRDKEMLTATAFIADQTPSVRGAHWLNFLHQDTPFFMGTGKIARKLAYPVVYVSVRREKRGKYRIWAEDLVPEPTQKTPEEIVELFARRLEQDIQDIPELWLWTHRRWKHQRKKEVNTPAP